jgi:hypothetical protein
MVKAPIKVWDIGDKEWGAGMANRPVQDLSQTFLLHCWHAPGSSLDEESAWRFSLTHVNKIRLKKGFADIKALMAYLEQVLAAEPDMAKCPDDFINLTGSSHTASGE